MRSLYDILGIAKDAAYEAIKKAYRKKAFATHPDSGGTDAEFHAVQLAYDVLSDEDRRKIYDETGVTGEAKNPDDQCMEALIAMALELTEKIMDVDHQNLVEHMRQQLNISIGNNNTHKAMLKEKIAKFKKASVRFKVVDGKPNTFKEALANQAAKWEDSIAGIDAVNAKCSRSLELLSDFTYECMIAGAEPKTFRWRMPDGSIADLPIE